MQAQQQPQAMWTCVPCNRTMHPATQASHLAGGRHAAAIANPGAVPTTAARGRGRGRGAARARGRGAGTSTTTTPRELHPNGKPKIRISEVQSVYGDVEAIPGRYWPGYGELVTPADVRAASDQWDAASVAYDIDTQWGLMPQGGAYKDSETYYGGGDFDGYDSGDSWY